MKPRARLDLPKPELIVTKRIALLLSGCGAWDGSDIHETVLTLVALDRAGAEVICIAPDLMQYHVLNHLTQEEVAAQRNMLLESARLARGKIVDLATIDPSLLDALIMPGGFGAVKNLSQFALKGPTREVNPQVRDLLEIIHRLKKPIGAIALAAIPLVIALADYRPEVAVSTDEGIAAAIEIMGGSHKQCKSNKIWVDRPNKIVTLPASMPDMRIGDVAAGVNRVVAKVLELIG